MTPLYLFNTLGRKKELFQPINPGIVGLYTCGPTVYNLAHLGNLRSYVFEDILKRTLVYNGYQVEHVMNITDVGHLTDDGDSGEDKMEKGARREGKTAWEIAEFFSLAFKADLKNLNIIFPNQFCKATDYIPEQIALIKVLEQKGYTYQISDGIYFDAAKVKDYTKLSKMPLKDLQEGSRVEINPEKRNPYDFALWKFSPQDFKRQMEWDSPWGIGFPGWHIECSAMSLKLLGDKLDIHCGGIDHINTHHTNEIAQSEAATGKKFFNYWLHNAFLNISGGEKMAKSSGNFLTLNNTLIEKGLDPLAFRLLLLQTSYRKPMEYSEAILQSANQALQSLRSQIAKLSGEGKILEAWKQKFILAINDDLNTAKALAVLNALLKSKEIKGDILATVRDFDQVLGLELDRVDVIKDIPQNILDLVNRREVARNNKDYQLADKLRKEIAALGYGIKDSDNTPEIYAL